eukprot:CAMPEP_0184391192 /NCGR_PEP_ID=MMETSP0007-20130409/13911_1 /TAXON_ID=97485 /ORGANISM="Prymnesium parvum, Strain Texoma1" /LENGTH=105 /DNA_ID=CAMNT_0026741221 /DNA_START=163 /DNA_END=476 /DNA_ORIENTATION=-
MVLTNQVYEKDASTHVMDYRLAASIHPTSAMQGALRALEPHERRAMISIWRIFLLGVAKMKPQGPSCAIRSERLGKQRIVEPESSVNVLVARPRAPVSEAAGGVG